MKISGKILVVFGSILALFLMIFPNSAKAHFMWINTGDYTPTSDSPVKFTIGWGHDFASPVGKNSLIAQDIALQVT